MEKGEQFRRQNRPTMQQLRYLKQLREADKKRGAQRSIAAICGVNASTVNRFFKNCIDRGFLTEELDFTEKGTEWYERYEKLYGQLLAYLEDIGAKLEEAEQTADNMVENIDIHMLELMVQSHQKKKSVYVGGHTHLDNETEHNLYKLDNHRVVIYIYRINRKNAAAKESMAMRGFEPSAQIIREGEKSYLRLTRRDMAAHSKLSGSAMSGHVKTLKYEKDAQLNKAPIKDNDVYIPLEAFQYHCWEDVGLMAWVPITVTCSVGRAHMPESTALLYFWA